MNKLKLLSFLLAGTLAHAQNNPVITSWLQNTSVTGSYYVTGNSTPISNGLLVNCQKVEYSNNWVYVTTAGIPAYPTGPFQDGNPSQASNQNAIFQIPLNPTQNTGSLTATSGGNIGIFINGVALFDYRDGVAWNNTTNTLCGGPGNPPAQAEWALFKIGTETRFPLKNLALIVPKDILPWAITIITKIRVLSTLI